MELRSGVSKTSCGSAGIKALGIPAPGPHRKHRPEAAEGHSVYPCWINSDLKVWIVCNNRHVILSEAFGVAGCLERCMSDFGISN
jgi:hypothetical protein